MGTTREKQGEQYLKPNPTLSRIHLTQYATIFFTRSKGRSKCSQCTEHDKQQHNHHSFSHNLHHAITNMLNNILRIGRAISICERIVAAFGTSWKRRDLAIAQMQEQPGEKFVASVSIKQNDLCTYYNYSFTLKRKYIF